MSAEARFPALSEHPVYGQMRDRIDELEEENRQLRAALRPTLVFPRAWRLTAQETAVLAAIYARPIMVGHEALRLAVLGPGDELCEGYISVYLVRLRQKLRPFGIEIDTFWGQGVALSAEGRELITAALANGAV